VVAVQPDLRLLLIMKPGNKANLGEELSKKGRQINISIDIEIVLVARLIIGFQVKPDPPINYGKTQIDIVQEMECHQFQRMVQLVQFQAVLVTD
jgi:hypothetical protein